ncbi:MAG TPA: carboxypeptidase regulatory-like domain-containing protein, partial [Candidatus Polarisedimenticolia bacterium]|nr:carboxypeptidase regulatory-like domain-containing protein [Candidatus Polarisedimenticolia bacterium]
MGQSYRARWLLAVAFLSTATPLLAISESSLLGKITDKDNLPLPGVTLVLRNDTLAFQEQGTLTDAQGDYRFAHLPPGAGYKLTVSMPGCATLIFSDLRLEGGATVMQNVTLRPGSELKEVVRVQGKGETVDTEKATASTTFSSTFIAELPILGRDYQDILTLAPGVTDVNHTGNPNIHGARDTDVVTLVDGVSTTDPFTGLFGQHLNIESIQEIEVITSAASAKYSRAQGGFASILTKSGGNEFKGTFKMFVRSSRLDRDGAGIENPELSGGFPGGKLYLEQNFADLKPFLSVSGAIVRNKLWYYLANEYILEETPINALTQAFVTRTLGYREFLKTTWQMSPAQRLALSLILDRERNENQGISSLEDVRSGYSFLRGGPTVTLSESSVFGPRALLESSVSWFDNRFSQLPTMDPDTNGNGILFVDDHPELGGNGDGILDAKERDPGEDYDRDGFYDVFEDINHNDFENAGEDFDHNGWVEIFAPFCEGYHHEDRNCNGYLDSEQDANLNGRFDPEEDTGILCDPGHGYCPGGRLPGTRGNGRFDTEDANGNGALDVLDDSGYASAPFWHDANQNGYPDPGEYQAPLAPDMDLIVDRDGRTYGPNPYEYRDHRKRITWSEDLSIYIADLGGTHDIKLGMGYEHEGYDSDTIRRPNFSFPNDSLHPVSSPKEGAGSYQVQHSVMATLGIPASVNNTAVGNNLGFFLQDTYKPLPNLTLGLGIRLDLEDLRSFGFTPFDPAAERDRYDALMNLAGYDMKPYDFVTATGLCNDPIRSCGAGANLSALNAELRNLAHHQLTRHNLD